MAQYWLDAMVFISPNQQGYYSFDLAPTFWQLLEQKAKDGILASTRKVCDELTRRRDSLSVWVDARKSSSLFVDPDQQVQEAYKKVADYVVSNYKYHRAEEFLGGADPWLIAHAMIDKAKVVTHEMPNSLAAQEVKIPNVCKAFNVVPITLFEMFRELNIVLEFRG
ncbi:MAG: DUF4411 family protein [Chloroflexota bacterium]|nr:DUF4411 family protein [Chloroflexota bacterium]